MRTIAQLSLGAALVAMLAGAPAALAAQAKKGNHKNIAHQVYRQYCAACHGSNGKGDGVVSGFMRPRPTDLTQLAKKNNGHFPYVETMRVIDGRTSVRAHGDPKMPVWGELLRPQATLPLSKNAEVRGKVQLITDYLQSIQQK